MKKLKIARTEVFERFVHVRGITDPNAPLQVQAVSESAKLVTVKVNQKIYSRVLGERHGSEKNKFTLGLRKLTRVKFRAHFDDKDVVQAVDIIPNRMFVSGAAPSAAGIAGNRGFDIHEDEELNGFDVWSEDPRSGETLRIAYAGMSEQKLCAVLDALRSASFGNKRIITLEDHKVEKIEDGTYRCKPVKAAHYTT